jgi:tRNA modification GTPase
MRDGDTIVALSSGALPSGVAVIRLSGPAAGEVLAEMLGGLPEPRRLLLADIALDGEKLDRGLVAWFPAPNSFTGEDCAELQVHGSPAGVKAMLARLAARSDIRLAEAGEFTRRAFENGKLDLTEIEGLGDLLAAETEGQRKQALARAEGGLSRQALAWREILIGLRAEIEARLDFSDEGDVPDVLPQSWLAEVQQLAGELQMALADLDRGRIVREGARIALAGPPNAGKSSLLNALARSDVAIVTEEAGTTRDVREVAIDLDGQLTLLVDMAGLRETDSKAEAEGVRRARNEIARADLILWLLAPDVEAPPMPAGDIPVWMIATKSDLKGEGGVQLAVSARTGAGIADLVERLSAFVADLTGRGEPALVSRERDRQCLTEALQHLQMTDSLLDAPELAAEQLRAASAALERLLGRIDAETVLDRLFTAFCIGK